MSRFARPAKSLQNVFPSSGREQARPSEVTETVHLVHPFPSPSEGLDILRFESFVSVPSTNPVVQSTRVPEGFYDEVLAGDLLSNDAAMRRLVMSYITRSDSSTVIGHVEQDSAFTVAWLGGGVGNVMQFPAIRAASLVPRPLMIGPGCLLQLNGATAIAVYTISFSIVSIRRPLGELPLMR